jgi:hypothetical protein
MTLGTAIFLTAALYLMVASPGFRIFVLTTATGAALLLAAMLAWSMAIRPALQHTSTEQRAIVRSCERPGAWCLKIPQYEPPGTE